MTRGVFIGFLASCVSLSGPTVRAAVAADIEGTVEVKGVMGPKFFFTAGYVGQSGKTALANGAGIELRVPPLGDAKATTTTFAPRNSWAAWKGKQGSFGHTGLTPGKYLVYVSVKDRFVDWQVVEVKDAAARIKLSYTLDLAEAGQLDVDVPDAGDRTHVRLAPLDKDGKPPLHVPSSSTPDFVNVITIPAAKGNVTIGALKPGKYLVSRQFLPLLKDCVTVEVTTGKTTKVRLEKGE